MVDFVLDQDRKADLTVISYMELFTNIIKGAGVIYAKNKTKAMS